MAQKEWYGESVGLADPSNEPVAVAPSDDDDLPGGRCNYLYVGTGGDLVVSCEADGANPVTYANVPDGAYIWCRALRVMATSTAADILAHY